MDVVKSAAWLDFKVPRMSLAYIRVPSQVSDYPMNNAQACNRVNVRVE